MSFRLWYLCMYPWTSLLFLFGIVTVLGLGVIFCKNPGKNYIDGNLGLPRLQRNCRCRGQGLHENDRRMVQTEAQAH